MQDATPDAAIAQTEASPADGATPPIATLAYQPGTERSLPWDVRVVVYVMVGWCVLNLVRPAVWAYELFTDKRSTTLTTALRTTYVAENLLRGVLPVLLLIALLGLLRDRPNAARLCVYVAAVSLLTAVFPMLSVLNYAFDPRETRPLSRVLQALELLIYQGGPLVILLTTLRRPGLPR